jgi:hypothetical protein
LICYPKYIPFNAFKGHVLLKHNTLDGFECDPSTMVLDISLPVPPSSMRCALEQSVPVDSNMVARMLVSYQRGILLSNK